MKLNQASGGCTRKNDLHALKYYFEISKLKPHGRGMVDLMQGKIGEAVTQRVAINPSSWLFF